MEKKRGDPDCHYYSCPKCKAVLCHNRKDAIGILTGGKISIECVIRLMELAMEGGGK